MAYGTGGIVRHLEGIPQRGQETAGEPVGGGSSKTYMLSPRRNVSNRRNELLIYCLSGLRMLRSGLPGEVALAGPDGQLAMLGCICFYPYSPVAFLACRL